MGAEPKTAKYTIPGQEVLTTSTSQKQCMETEVPRLLDVGQGNRAVAAGFRRTGEQLESFKHLYKEFEVRNYRFFKSSAAKRKALAERRVRSGFYSGR